VHFFSWLSPEVLQNSFYSTKSDTWSLGVVLYEIWSNGTRPYDLMSKMQVRKFVLDKNTLTAPEGKHFVESELYPIFRNASILSTSHGSMF
jgi:serine/threonine protein kinase